MRFTLVDEIVALSPGQDIRARRTFPPDLELFVDHFPGMPVVPGVLLVEMMGQAGASCIEAGEPPRGKAMLIQIRRAAFRRWVRPGESIDVRAEVSALGASHATLRCRAEVGGVLAAEADLMFTFVPWEAVGTAYRNEPLERWRRAQG